MTPAEAIRKHCVECVGSPYEIKNCRGDFLYATEMSVLQIQDGLGPSVCQINTKILSLLYMWIVSGR